MPLLDIQDAVEDFIKRRRIRVPELEPPEQSSFPAHRSAVEYTKTAVARKRTTHLDEQYKNQRQDFWEQESVEGTVNKLKVHTRY